MARIYAAMRDRLLVTGDGEGQGTTTRLEGRAPESVAASPAAPGRVFVGTFEDGLHRSTDGGGSFERVDDRFASDAVMSLAIDPHDASVVYAGTEPSRVYRSRDAGETWTRLEGLTDLPSEAEWYFPPRPHTHHVRWLEVDPFDPDRLYVGIEAGAFVYSEDGGETWHERPPGSRRDNHSLATHSDREGRLYSAAGDGYAVSDDGGEHWEHPQAGLEHRYCWSVVPHPADPERVLVSSTSGASRAHTAETAESYVYRTSDDGAGSDSTTAASRPARACYGPCSRRPTTPSTVSTTAACSARTTSVTRGTASLSSGRTDSRPRRRAGWSFSDRVRPSSAPARRSDAGPRVASRLPPHASKSFYSLRRDSRVTE